MKRFLVALTLTCVLSVSAMAGDIPTIGAPSPGQTQGGDSTALGEIPSVNSPAPADIPTCGLSLVITLLDLAF